MYNVSDLFKEAVLEPVTEVSAYIELENGTIISDETDLISLNILAESSFMNTCMRKVGISLTKNHNLLDQRVKVYGGVKVSEDTFEYINYGTFIIKESEANIDTDVVNVSGYDLMVLSEPEYEPLNITYSCTLMQYTQALCQKIGLELKNTTFFNENLEIPGDYYELINAATYRFIISEIAEVTCSIAIIKDDMLYFKPLKQENDFSLTFDNLFSLRLEPKYGAINSLVLSRNATEDSIAYPNNVDEPIELKIYENQLLDKRREDVIVDIFNNVEGLEFYPFELTSEGLAFFEVGDKVQIENRIISYDENQEEVIEIEYIDTYIFNINLSFDGGISESLYTQRPSETETDYKTVGGITKKIYNTEIKVDKQNQEIIGLVSVVEKNTEDIVMFKQTIEGFDFENRKIGGSNLVKNSAGWNGLEFWDSENVEAIQTVEIADQTISKKAFYLNNGYLKQSLDLQKGKEHLVSFRIKSGIGGTAIYLVDGDVMPSGNPYANNPIKNADGIKGNEYWDIVGGFIESENVSSLTGKALKFVSNEEESYSSQIIDIEIGKKYILELKVKNSTDTIAKIIFNHDEENLTLFESDGISDDWQTIAHEFEAVSGSSELIFENTNFTYFEEQEVSDLIYEFNEFEVSEEHEFEAVFDYKSDGIVEIDFLNGEFDYGPFYILQDGDPIEYPNDEIEVLEDGLRFNNIENYVDENAQNVFKGFLTLKAPNDSGIIEINHIYDENVEVTEDGELLVADLLLKEVAVEGGSTLLFYRDNPEFEAEEFEYVLLKVTTGNLVSNFFVEHIGEQHLEGSYISDVMLVGGNTEKEWEPYQNELYSSNVLIDENGIKIKNSISDIETRITNQEFAVYHEDKKALSVNKDLTTLQKTEIKDDLTIGRTIIFNRDDGIDIVVLEE